MKKFSEQEVDQFISQLFGQPLSIPSESKPVSFKLSGSYQLPLKVGKNNVPIDDQNKPWIVGGFLPGQFVNERHKSGHEGVDLAAERNTPIYPIGPGKVTETMVYAKGGNTVKIEHEDGSVISYYAHMQSINVKVGQEVDNNTVIGLVGDSGNAKGTQPHVHYTVKVNGSLVDPMSIVGKPVGSLSKKAYIKETIDVLEKFAKF
jgi:murein DD-endopeptidase MepM/ murein hydrolase activator NlpD